MRNETPPHNGGVWPPPNSIVGKILAALRGLLERISGR
jgi:hypothetical protein